jgi:hypothetical protein
MTSLWYDVVYMTNKQPHKASPITRPWHDYWAIYHKQTRTTSV